MRCSSALPIGFGVAIAALTSANFSHADITAANWVNSSLFNYRVTHMPDMDQKRSSLPCNGSIHCVPTCATNMVMWAANHGFPSVQPGPGYWEGNTNYVLASNTIFLMGLQMQTSCASGGTNGANANAGLSSWLLFNPQLVVNDHLSVGNFAPTFAGVGKSLCAGRVGCISYGYYDVVGDLKGMPLVQRDGGHCVTVVKIRRSGTTRELWVRNPASDEGDLTTQSPFFNDILNARDLTVIVMPDMVQKTMIAVNYTPGDTTIKLVDGHRTLTPAMGYSWDSSLTQVQLLGPTNLLNPQAPPTQTFPSPTGTSLLNLCWNDLSGELLMICGASEVAPQSLQALDPLTGVAQQIPLPLPPNLVTTGPGDRVYVVECGPNGCNMLTIVLRPAPNVPPSQPIITLPHIPSAMTFDDANDQLVLLSSSAHKLMRINAGLTGPLIIQDIPSSVPLGAKAQLAIDPTDMASVWLWTDATNTLYKLSPGSGSTLNAMPLTHSAITQPRGIDFNDQGHLLVSNAGSVLELEFVSGAWQVVPNGIFAGLPAQQWFHVTRTRTNFTRGVHDTPAWTTNIDANLIEPNPIAPDCPADIAPNLNVDGTVNVADLLVVINAWGPCASAIRCPADIVQDSTVNVSDLLAVINQWGPCP